MIGRYFDLPDSLIDLAREPDVVLLESSRPDEVEHSSLLFREPLTVLELQRPEDAPQFFRRR